VVTTQVMHPMRYILPSSAVAVGVVLRMAIVVDPRGGHLGPQVVMAVSARGRSVPAVSAELVPVPDGICISAMGEPGALREAFDASHPKTAAIIADLSSRAEQFLAGLRMGEDPAEVIAFGQALDVVHRELAGADRMRREWVSRQGFPVHTANVELTQADLLHLTACPAVLPENTPVPQGPAQDLAHDFGVLVAVADGGQPRPDQHPMIAVYRRAPLAPISGVVLPESVWRRDDLLSQPEAGDGEPESDGSDSDRTQAGVERTPSAVALAHSEAVAVRCQLDLLDASDEYSRLASTHDRAAELAALQAELRLIPVPRQRSR